MIGRPRRLAGTHLPFPPVCHVAIAGDVFGFVSTVGGYRTHLFLGAFPWKAGPAAGLPVTNDVAALSWLYHSTDFGSRR